MENKKYILVGIKDKNIFMSYEIKKLEKHFGKVYESVSENSIQIGDYVYCKHILILEEIKEPEALVDGAKVNFELKENGEIKIDYDFKDINNIKVHFDEVHPNDFNKELRYYVEQTLNKLKREKDFFRQRTINIDSQIRMLHGVLKRIK